MRLYQPNFGNAAIAFRERILEDIRRSEFPEKPSRLSSCFVSPNLDSALTYRQTNGHTMLVYEVEPVDASYNAHRGDWLFSYPPNQIYYFDGLEDMARRYWRSEQIANPEIVLNSAVRITKIIEIPPAMMP